MSAHNADEISPVHSHSDQATYAGEKHASGLGKDGDDYEVEVKGGAYAHDIPLDEGLANEAKHDLHMTGADLAAVEEKLEEMSLSRCRRIMSQVRELHEHDQNFPTAALDKIKYFLDEPEVESNPDKHAELIHEMKLEALLVTENSPYAEVRAVVDNWDDPTLPVFTIRTWVIGVVLAAVGAFINQLFFIRYPAVSISANVAQLIALPIGRLFARILPDKRFRLFGREHSLNPGRFNQKEHMLITIMANSAYNTPYTGYTVITQALPVYFGEAYAFNFGYQILSSLGTNFVGYGLAGLTRRFIVFPSFCVWPTSLVTVALNKAFHTEGNAPVPGPFRRMYTWSREKFFLIAFASMFVYWFFPGFIFQALATFNWMSWIAPDNFVLNTIVGSNNGLGLNPWPTFDFNQLTAYGPIPLVLPTFTVMNQFLGMIISFFMIIGFYWSNAWESGYLPINSNHVFDNAGGKYNVSAILDADNNFSEEGYQNYSMAYMAAGNLVIYFWFFAIYTATISYTYLYHRHEIRLAFTNLWRGLRKSATSGEEDLAEDIHFKLMKKYKETPEWWFLLVLGIAMALGMIGVGVYPSHTTPAVVIFGIIMAAICVVPVGLIASVTGIQVTMNVLAEFIGGAIAKGNAVEMMYFKMYGYVTTAQAVYFANDLKLAHYLKIPPRYTFTAQMVATVVSTFVCTAVFNFQMGFRNVCTPEADFGFSCPGHNTFFTAAVFWGTLGPQKLFGPGQRYNLLLLGFPVGLALPFICLGLQKLFPSKRWLRQLHPVMICAGALQWAPYNFAFYVPTVWITWLSWQYVKPRYLAFWSKYNYVLAAAWTAGIAVAAIVIFFALEIPNVSIDWWGNSVPYEGCEGDACTLLQVPDAGYFGPTPGTNSFS